MLMLKEWIYSIIILWNPAQNSLRNKTPRELKKGISFYKFYSGPPVILFFFFIYYILRFQIYFL